MTRRSLETIAFILALLFGLFAASAVAGGGTKQYYADVQSFNGNTLAITWTTGPNKGQSANVAVGGTPVYSGSKQVDASALQNAVRVLLLVNANGNPSKIQITASRPGGASRAAAAPGSSGAEGHEPEQSYKGKVTAIKGNKVSIAVSDGSTGNWTVAPNATIGSGAERFPLSSVHVGDEVSVAVSQDGVIHILGVIRQGGGSGPARGEGASPGGKGGEKEYPNGTVVSAGGGKLEVRMGDGSTHQFKVAPNAQITFANKPVEVGTIRSGDRANVWAAQDGAANKIMLLYYQNAPKHGPQHEVEPVRNAKPVKMN